MAGLLEFLQAASNSAASNVSAPVDGIAWLLKKAGIDVGTPVGGSDWMEQRGLTKPVKQSGASVAGETAGLLSPMLLAAKAPQVAKGLLQMADNAAAPRSAGMAASQRGAFIFPREEAMKTAQKNATEMLGLPPNNTAAERAAALGFNNDVLHGGTNVFDSFKVSDRSNVYATDVPAIADIYANATGRHAALREINAGPNVMPLKYRGKMLEISDVGENGSHGWSTDNLAAALGVEPARNLAKKVPERGYSGVKINHMLDLGGEQSQYVFPDPSVLRSRFAAFDPARLNEPDLLATLAAMGIGLPALAGLMNGEGN